MGIFPRRLFFVYRKTPCVTSSLQISYEFLKFPSPLLREAFSSARVKAEAKAQLYFRGGTKHEKTRLYGTQRSTSGRERACLRGRLYHKGAAYLYGKGRHNGIYQGWRSTALGCSDLYQKRLYHAAPAHLYERSPANPSQKHDLGWEEADRNRSLWRLYPRL